jgi:hypothetical protein
MAEDKIIVFDTLLGQTIDGITITEKHIDYAENKVASWKRNQLKKESNKDHKQTLKYIAEHYCNADEVLKQIPSIDSLVQKNLEKANGSLEKKSEVKFDDVRNMDLSIQSLEGFKETEKKIIQQRLLELSEDFNLEKSTDKFLAWRVAVCELKIIQYETLIALNPKAIKDVQSQIDILDKQYKVFCESLNVLKRQRDSIKKQSDNKSSISDTLNELDNKSVDDLKHEAELEEQEELKMMKKRKKR